MGTFSEEFNLLLRARYPAIYINTVEEERAEDAIVAASDGRAIYLWDFVTGYDLQGTDAGTAQRNPLQALQYIEKTDDRAPAIFVLRDFQRFLTDISVARKLRNLGRKLRSLPKTVVILAPVLDIPADLSETITVLEFDLPSSTEIGQAIDRLVGLAQTLAQSERDELVRACQGLTLARVRQALAKAIAQAGSLSADAVDLILEEKRQKIRQTQILEFYPAATEIADIGGLDNLKSWLMRRGSALSEKARRYGLPQPRGLLLVGIQGTGKSLTAKAIAHHWHLPLLRLDIGRLFAGLVGESESRTRQLIQLSEAMSPCVLWIDEIDKAFGTSASSDGGTTGRVLGTLITWMAEKTAPVFVVATANNIQILPPELLRKGRFDEIFFVDLPAQEERAEIFNVHLGKLRPQTVRDYDIQRLAYETPDFSGAEIEQSIIEAMHLAFSQNRDFTTEDILESVALMVPLARTAKEQVELLQSWATQGKVRLASQRSFLQQRTA
ncbi:AAA family ATPase [Synechococcus sp. PCC 7336]|uniref:AAA family ATPase n=1 Tax=Synechococcus sp. PCC 7336 TaxID=195250 RepID=UPI000344A2DC|nr:AAA family ATPase [Synechococcus sp. PCC 7336]